jgi:peptide deformylase
VTVRPILVYGDPRLEAPNAPVEDFDDRLRVLADELFEAARRAPGLGLAAPQIGVNIRLATIDLSIGRDPEARIVLANPEIVRWSGRTSLEEGCLSFPGLFTTIERPAELTVRAQDELGRWRDINADGLLAQAVCHEVDHLDAVLLVHHLRGMKRRLFLRRVDKMRKQGVWPQSAYQFSVLNS